MWKLSLEALGLGGNQKVKIIGSRTIGNGSLPSKNNVIGSGITGNGSLPSKNNVIGSRITGNGSLPFINNVLLVKGLMNNLLSISQLSDTGYGIIFNKKSCKSVSQKDGYVLFNVKRMNNIYNTRLSDLENQNVKCLMSVSEEQWTWHGRLGHIIMRRILMLNKLNLVRGLPNLKFSSNAFCEACQKG